MKKKYTVILFALLLPSSCTVMQGNQTQGTYLYASLGGDTRELAMTPGGATAAEVQTSNSFKDASGAVKSYVWAAALKGVANSAAGAWKSTSKAAEATKRAGIAEKGLTDRAGIAADVQKAEIEATPTPEF